MKKFKNFGELKILKTAQNVEKNKPIQIIASKKSLFVDNYFTEIILEDESSSFKTVFTDNEVIKILEKISNRKIRNLVWEFQRIINTESDRSLHLRFILHTICLKLLKKYGSKMLSFIINLNVLQRPNEEFEPFPDLYRINLDREDSTFDTIRLTNKNTTKFLGFEISEYNKKPYMIICNSDGYLQGRINGLGYIEDDFIDRIKFNIFEFLEGSELSYYGAILNCYCSVCARELTNTESIYFGIGPICRGDVYR